MAFKSPVAPTIAAKREKKNFLSKLKSWCLKRINSSISKFILFEGAGGIMVPIEKQKTFIDLFQHINIPVILLVVGSYLGTVSHTLSALDNLHKRNIKVINVVINEGINSNKKAFTENTLLLKASIKKKLQLECYLQIQMLNLIKLN